MDRNYSRVVLSKCVQTKDRSKERIQEGSVALATLHLMGRLEVLMMQEASENWLEVMGFRWHSKTSSQSLEQHVFSLASNREPHSYSISHAHLFCGSFCPLSALLNAIDLGSFRVESNMVDS